MDPFTLLKNSADKIYLLSAMSSLVFALVIYSLLRNDRILQAKQWATPFAHTFLVLAILYVLILVDHFSFPPPMESPPTDPVSIFRFLCSGITNYLFLLSAFLLSAPAMDQQRMVRIKTWLVGSPFVRSPLFLVFCAIALFGVAGEFPAIGELAAAPDAIVSVIVLLVMGIALYQNGVRTDKAMAWVALASSIAYAVVYVLTEAVVLNYLIQFLPPDLGTNIKSVKNPLSSLILLIGKFGFFFCGYSLMLSISGPLQGIERLLENVLHKEKEYLESDGIVRSIYEELGLRRVRLLIKLPGSKEKQIALYEYPPSNGNQPEPQILPYREGEIYDHVMTGGIAYRKHRENSFHWIFPATYKIGVPVFFHDSVIACLEAEVGKKKFTEGNRINLERLANLISPAVQTYREMSALNKLSQDLAQLQIGVVEYDLDKDFERIARKIYYVTSPTTVGISIEIGFWEYHATFPHGEPLEDLVKELLCTGPSAEDVLTHDGSCRWLSKGLTIPQVSAAGQKTGEQVFGNFVLGLEKGKQRTEHPTIGTNPACRRALCDLLTDTLLDFVRGHLNQLTDRLGVRLSGLQGTTVEPWLYEVERTAQEARLLWVVGGYSDDDNPDPRDLRLLGDPARIAIVREIETAGEAAKWQIKEGLSLYSFDDPQAGTCHVIKRVLQNSRQTLQKVRKDSRATLWIGVARPKFGRELDYISPWKYFLDHFCEIADAGLDRMLIAHQEEERNARMVEFQSLAITTITTGNALHELAKLARALTSPIGALEEALREDAQCNADVKALVRTLRPTSTRIQALLTLFSNALKHNERRDWLLDEALIQVCEKKGNSWNQHNIEIERPDPLVAAIDVPFHSAIFALEVILDNARDAIAACGMKEGNISIKTVATVDQVVCEITDNGPGVSDELRKTLLKKPTKSDKPNSNGVGLYLAVFLLRGYGGDIFLAPREEGKGATFSVRFPKGGTRGIRDLKMSSKEMNRNGATRNRNAQVAPLVFKNNS